MLAEPIEALMRDVRRLLAVGGESAAMDEGLRKRLALLRSLSDRVPALAALSAAIERVTAASPGQAPPLLLDLLVLVRQLVAALAHHGLDGPLEPLPESGPWSTPATISELYALHELDARPVSRKRFDRAAQLQSASERCMAADLRNIAAFLDVLAGPYTPAAGVLLTEVLPFFGRALLPDLQANRQRGILVVVALYRYDTEAALVEATMFLQRAAGLLPLLPHLGRAAVRAFVEELDARPEQVVSEWHLQRAGGLALRRVGRLAVPILIDLLQAPERAAPQLVLDALSELGPLAGEAVPMLLRLLDGPCDRLRRAAIITLGRIGPNAHAAIPALRLILNEWGQKELQMAAMEALGAITRRPG
jgi:hypothetical protein